VFSQRSGFDRGPNRVAIALQEARQSDRALIDLTLSNPTLAHLPYDAEALSRALHHRESLAYRPEPLGLLSAREAIASHHKDRGVSIRPDRICLTASTSEAYAYLLKLLCDPEDDVLVPQPSYPLFEHLATLESVRLKPYRLRYEEQWRIDIDEIKRSTTERTRAIVVVSPNNPTGSYVKRDELEALGELAVPIISDEVFAGYPLVDDPTRVESALQTDQTLVFSLFGLSKLAALPQLKLSWLCINGPEPQVLEARERLELIADTFLSVNTAVQLAVPRILKSYHRLSDAIRARTQRNLDKLRRLQCAASLLDLEGGWYATLQLPNIKSDEKWAVELVQKAGVSVYPGYFFDFEQPSVVVISLIVPEALFDQGVQRLAARVDVATKIG